MNMTQQLTLRIARPEDADAITALIERSVNTLQSSDYTDSQRRAAIGQVFLVDHGLIADGSYFVVMAPDGRLAGAGGWSNRRALHGGHTHGDTGERIDPELEPARIRAFFTNPDFARQGVASLILSACEKEARSKGFMQAALGATLTGVPFYKRHGYVEDDLEETPLAKGETLTIVRMSKTLV